MDVGCVVFIYQDIEGLGIILALYSRKAPHSCCSMLPDSVMLSSAFTATLNGLPEFDVREVVRSSTQQMPETANFILNRQEHHCMTNHIQCLDKVHTSMVFDEAW